MHDQDIISNLILRHWNTFRPKMVTHFQKENRLEAELKATVRQFNAMMYELTQVKKMGYQEAWEMTMNQFLLPEEEESSLTNPTSNPNPPATSE